MLRMSTLRVWAERLLKSARPRSFFTRANWEQVKYAMSVRARFRLRGEYDFWRRRFHEWRQTYKRKPGGRN
jgi:hypothetical protein